MRWKDADYFRVHGHRILKAKMITTLMVDLFPVKTSLLPLKIVSGWCSSWIDCVNLLTINPDWLQTNFLSLELRDRSDNSRVTRPNTRVTHLGASFVLSCMLLLPKSFFLLKSLIVLSHGTSPVQCLSLDSSIGSPTQGSSDWNYIQCPFEEVFLGYWSSVRSRRLDIGQVLFFCVFIDQDGV